MFSNLIIIYYIIIEFYIKYCLYEEMFIFLGLVLMYNLILEILLEVFINLWV